MQEFLEDLKDAAKFKRVEIQDLYAKAEGFIAKVKLFLALNKKAVVILIATHFAAVMAGMMF